MILWKKANNRLDVASVNGYDLQRIYIDMDISTLHENYLYIATRPGERFVTHSIDDFEIFLYQLKLNV